MMSDEDLLDTLHALTTKALDVFCANCMVCTFEQIEDIEIKVWEGHKISFEGDYVNDVAHTVWEIENRISYIECNLDIFRQLSEDQWYNEIAHEVAHAIEFHIFGESDHNERWAETHKLMGGNGLPGYYFVLDNGLESV